MPLHRDIFWVGKQWAVTGHGMQAIDQKGKGQFDIAASRVWDDGLLESLRDQKWLDADDFNQGLAAARNHYPLPPGHAVAPEESYPRRSDDKPVEQQKPAAKIFAMRVKGWPAKFVKPWRIRIR